MTLPPTTRRRAQAYLDLLGADPYQPGSDPVPQNQRLTDYCESGYWHCRQCLKAWSPPETHYDEDAGLQRCPRCGRLGAIWHPPIF